MKKVKGMKVKSSEVRIFPLLQLLRRIAPHGATFGSLPQRFPPLWFAFLQALDTRHSSLDSAYPSFFLLKISFC
jgi:hypothetical protein